MLGPGIEMSNESLRSNLGRKGNGVESKLSAELFAETKIRPFSRKHCIF